MKYTSLLLLAIFTLFGTCETAAQRPNLEKIVAIMEKDGCAIINSGKTKICKFDYEFENKTVEAVTIRPAAEGKFPSLLLAPGFNMTAKDLIPAGIMFAHENFASVAITPPGFGKSEGKADFVGENTLKVFAEGWNRLRHESFVDPNKMGIYGHSRGGMAASLLATRLPNAKAAVLASGVYDFKKAFDEISLKGIRDRMIKETDLSEAAFRSRSSILEMEKLKIPVLILHGEKDEKTPVNQAYLMRDKLTTLKKDFEIKIYPEAGHELEIREVIAAATDFYKRKFPK
jgi:dipeptidyl aminopeptidase/acylaminoacyl peptidase